MANPRPGAGSDIGFNITKQTTASTGSGSDNAGVAGASPITLPPEFIPPPGAEYFTLQDEQDSAGAATKVVFTFDVAVGSPFVVPENHRAIINTIQFFSSSADASLAGSAFALLVQGNPKLGFNSLKIPQLGGAQGIVVSPAFVRVAAAQGIGAQFTNVVGAAHHVGVFIQGWYWPDAS